MERGDQRRADGNDGRRRILKADGQARDDVRAGAAHGSLRNALNGPPPRLRVVHRDHEGGDAHQQADAARIEEEDVAEHLLLDVIHHPRSDHDGEGKPAEHRVHGGFAGAKLEARHARRREDADDGGDQAESADDQREEDELRLFVTA